MESILNHQSSLIDCDDDDDIWSAAETDDEQEKSKTPKKEDTTKTQNINNNVLLTRFQKWRQTTTPLVQASRNAIQGVVENMNNNNNSSNKQSNNYNNSKHSQSAEEAEEEEVNYLSESSYSSSSSIISDSESNSAVSYKSKQEIANGTGKDNSDFRGRYNDQDSSQNNKAKNLLGSIINNRKKNAVPEEQETQTNKILRSSSANHLKSIMDTLDEGQYVMLLGNGMMGVNLKQDYLQNAGVFVDFIVPDGNAAKSGLISIGDQVLKVADVDVSKGTIYDVPQIIASSTRPCAIILQYGHYAEAASSSFDYCTLAYAKLNQIVQATQKNKSLEFDLLSTPTLRNSSSLLDTEDENSPSNDEAILNNLRSNDDALDSKQQKLEMATDDMEDGDGALYQKNPYDDNNGKINVVYNRKVPSSSENIPLSSISVKIRKQPLSSSLFSAISYSLHNDAVLHSILREALILCCIDTRRLSFLVRFFQQQDEKYNPSLSAISQLKLYLDLLSYRDMFNIMPDNRRRELYLDIAYRYFLPKMKENGGTEPAPIDIHALLPPEILTDLAIQCHSGSYDPQQDELLWDIEQLVQKSLLSGSMFVYFLLSNEYARMRASMKNANTFVDPPLYTLCTHLTKSEDEKSFNSSHNHFLYILMFLLLSQQSTTEEKGQASENAELINNADGGAGGICCMIYIQKHVLNFFSSIQKDDETGFVSLIRALEQLWEVFLAPGGGLLDSFPMTTLTQDTLNNLRRLLVKALSPPLSVVEPRDYILGEFLHGNLKETLHQLSQDLYCDYATQLHPKYRQHFIHSLMCDEVDNYRQKEKEDVQEQKQHDTNQTADGDSNTFSQSDDQSDEIIPPLPSGSVKKLLRKLDLPSNLSRHCPLKSPILEIDSTEPEERKIIDCAVVFGIDDGMDSTGRLPALPIEDNTRQNNGIRRFSSISLVDGTSKDVNIPSTLENFAVVPSFRERVFSTALDESRTSKDGWEVSLVNFMMPDNNNKNVYGVSLVLHQSSVPSQQFQSYPTKIISKKDLPEEINAALTDKDVMFYSEENYGNIGEDSKEGMKRYVCLSERIPVFNEKLQNMRLSESLDSRQSSYGDDLCGITVGIALTCQWNTIPSMRTALSKLYEEFSKPLSFKDDEDHDSQRVCAPLVDILGTFSLKNIEESALKYLLDPFLTMSYSIWVDRPLSDQKEAFELAAGQALLESLPPLSFALTFITCLLEQKIVISSSRRSVLLSIATAMRNLLQPLDWSHLFVPLVPTLSVASDLLQYPAPFILGIPSEDEGSLELLNSLPEEVTLVDLDAGRVILARTLSGNFENFKSSHNHPQNAAIMVRSQVLCLAEALGSVIGASIHGPSWKSDSPLQVLPLPSSFRFSSDEQTANATDTMEGKFQVAKRICYDFIQELLVGVKSCCYWIEEKSLQPGSGKEEAVVMFDEARFLRIKDSRSQGIYLPLLLNGTSFITPDSTFPPKADLALSVEGFDLFLETFLRGQSMSTYISSRQEKDMVFS